MLSPSEIAGLVAYNSFPESVFFTTIQRQASEAEAPFRQALGELRELKVSLQFWQLLGTRCAVELSQANIDSFRDAPAIYFRKDPVNKTSPQRVVELNSPALYITAQNVGAGADMIGSSNAGNLSNRIPFCIGSRVMLTRNL
jgi:hypothetical protein